MSADMPPGELGNLLRYWRDVRGVSQLDLSLEAGISQRQISFIESGRSVPGRDTLLILAQALDVPLRERNALLLAAGYAPMYSEAPWNAQEMHSVVRALERVVRQHDPFPALVMDRHWNVLMTNDAAPRFFGRFIDMAARQGPRNMLHLMFDPQGMRPFVADWDSVARSLLQRVHRESVGHVVDDTTKHLLDELLAYPDVPRDWKTHHVNAAAPTMPVGDGALAATREPFAEPLGDPSSVPFAAWRRRRLIQIAATVKTKPTASAAKTHVRNSR